MGRRMGGGFCFVKTVSASEGSPVEGSRSKIHVTEHENPLMGSGLSLIPASHTFDYMTPQLLETDPIFCVYCNSMP